MSVLENDLANQIHLLKLPTPTRQFYYLPGRKCRCDFAWIEKKLIVEVEGAIYTYGRHVRGKGFELDCEKYNEAALLGYTVLRVTHKHIKNGQALKWIEQFLKRNADEK